MSARGGEVGKKEEEKVESKEAKEKPSDSTAKALKELGGEEGGLELADAKAISAAQKKALEARRLADPVAHVFDELLNALSAWKKAEQGSEWEPVTESEKEDEEHEAKIKEFVDALIAKANPQLTGSNYASKISSLDNKAEYELAKKLDYFYYTCKMLQKYLAKQYGIDPRSGFGEFASDNRGLEQVTNDLFDRAYRYTEVYDRVRGLDKIKMSNGREYKLTPETQDIISALKRVEIIKTGAEAAEGVRAAPSGGPRN